MAHFRMTSAATAILIGVVPEVAAAQPQPSGDFWRHPYMMGGGGWLAMIFGPVFMFAPLVVLVAVVVLAVRWAAGPWRGAERAPKRAPLDILKERFARGEIDKEEYEERRRVLTS